MVCRRAIVMARAAMLVVVMCASAGLGQEAADDDAFSAELLRAIPDLRDRLSRLTPEAPMDYFELAEEVADEARDPADVRLARQLYALAYEIDEARFGGERRLGPSVCLGIAELEHVEQTAAWLEAMAGAMDRRYAATDWNVTIEAEVAMSTAYDAASALGLVRAGEGRRAAALLEREDVRELMEAYEPLLGISGERGALTKIHTYASAWPCPECRNERWVTYQGASGRPEPRLCNTCLGDPGPDLSREELVAHLRFEARLLNGIQESWAAQIIVDRAAPLLDPEPEQLTATLSRRYRVEASRPYWRDGAWMERPE